MALMFVQNTHDVVILQDMLADLSRVSTMMQDLAGIVGRLPETSGDEDNEEKCILLLLHFIHCCLLLVYCGSIDCIVLKFCEIGCYGQ